MTLIIIALTIAALYSGGMWAVGAYISTKQEMGDSDSDDIRMLGLCFILALGFLGLILK